MKEHLLDKGTWLRGLLMLLYGLLYAVAEVVLAAVALFQFGAKLLTGKPNERLLGLGESLSRYAYQVWRFLSFNTEERPYPLGPWPPAPPWEAPEGRRAPARRKGAAPAASGRKRTAKKTTARRRRTSQAPEPQAPAQPEGGEAGGAGGTGPA